MKKLLVYILPVMLLASCVEGLDDYNIDRKNPSDVPAGSLFANATKTLVDNQTSPSVNLNVFRFFVQQWTTTTYTDEPQYDIITRNIPLNYWGPFYREVLIDLKEARELVEADQNLDGDVKNNSIAVTEILSVYAWSVLVNTWGDVPYSEALTDIPQPKYDDAATIYADLLVRLDNAISLITPSAGNFGQYDLLYSDDSEAWLKFAHSLKLRLGITLADVDEATARAAIESSASEAFTSNDDNAAFAYQTSTPNNNPVSGNLNPAFTARQDFIAGKTMVDAMVNLDDPRLPFYFTTVNGQYRGGTQGTSNNYAANSHASDKVIAPDFEGLLIDYSEVEFILAEAAARWGILGSPAEHYNNAITASILYWGGTQGDASAYLLSPAVNYLTAAGNYKQKIGTQKWLAFYNRGYDAWIEWKRLDYPALQPAVGAVSAIPVRFPYVTNEYTLNQTNVEAAASAIGGDDVETKIFWDVN
ncbi:SusD/RagB family nutrient-binding outer membrane lipoprotein [Parapedobacter sp. DT-150]|uniref:SusD/RagB family nutrient-binding outer membrane lipoprotein n=1 Tax=Parapedobacter sp. DT-150 TaxID=3396162 RepID=UPI003F1AD19F